MVAGHTAQMLKFIDSSRSFVCDTLFAAEIVVSADAGLKRTIWAGGTRTSLAVAARLLPGGEGATPRLSSRT